MTNDGRYEAKAERGHGSAGSERVRLGARRRASVASRVATAFAAFACLLGLGATAEAQGNVMVVQGDGICPAGSTALTYQQAYAHREAIRSQLGEWHIARLSGGGSMDGPGYHCQLRPADARPLGHTLCLAGPPVPPSVPPRHVTPTVGRYDGAHPHWRDLVEIEPGGRFHRASGDAGQWFVQGHELILAWDRWPAERLFEVSPGVYRAPSNGFTLTRQGRPITLPVVQPRPPLPLQLAVAMGSYDYAFHGRSDVVTLGPNGQATFARGHGGRWYVQGDTLVLDLGRRGTSYLHQVGPGRYATAGSELQLSLRQPPRWRGRPRRR